MLRGHQGASSEILLLSTPRRGMARTNLSAYIVWSIRYRLSIGNDIFNIQWKEERKGYANLLLHMYWRALRYEY